MDTEKGNQNIFKSALNKLRDLLQIDREVYEPTYRVVNIEHDDTDEYHVVIQLIGKTYTFRTKPETLLADDNMVNKFSPVDIRNLTYLGYLGINGPKYKILAKQFSEDNKKTVFAIHKKGEKNHRVLTADELSMNPEMIEGMSQRDAHMVGVTSAEENHLIEKKNISLLTEDSIH